MYLSIGRASHFLGVSISTLRRWEREKKLLPSFKTCGLHRRYEINELKTFVGKKADSVKKKVVAYARVSSHDQKEDLKRQVQRLKIYLTNETCPVQIIDDLGSGMNYKKKGLAKLIKLILSGEVSKLILTHKDRLLRFGSEIIFKICDYFGVEVKIIEEKKDLTDDQVLAFDVLEIITVFSARMYGKRSHQNKKVVA
jgi:putative resolvase